MNFNFQWNAKTISIYIFLLIVILILFKLITIKLNYKPIFSWWNDNSGNLYSKDFDIFAVMSSYESIIFYWISSIFGTLNTQIDRAQIMFLVNKIFPLTITPGISEITQFVLPRHIAQSIQFTRGDADLWFNKWLDDHKDYDDQSILTYKSIPEPKPNDKGEIIYNTADIVRIADSRTNKIGVYPSPNMPNDWLYLFVEWGAKTWMKEKDGTLLTPSLPPDEATEWLDCEKHPDNFLARYGIMPDSPLVVVFLSNLYNDPRTGLKLDAIAFKNLIGVINPGGWVGYLNGLYKSDINEDEYIAILYTTYAIRVDIPNPKASTSADCDTSANALSSISTGLGPIGIAVMLPFPANLFAGAVGVGLAIWQGISTKNKCDAEKKDDDKTT
jgi:hypothetical protein